MEEIPEKEKKRLKDLARYARDHDEQRYWEIYWARNNIFPAAIRSILRGEDYKKWRERTRESDAHYFDPQFTMEMEPSEIEDRHDWPMGPESWVEGVARNAERDNIEIGAFPFPEHIEDGFRLKKEKEIKQAADFIAKKYFGRRFYGERYSDEIERILRKTMYGNDLYLAETYMIAREMRKTIREIRETDDDRKKLEGIRRIGELAWALAMLKRSWAKDRENVDPLETRGPSWRKTRRYHILARMGPKALMDGTDILTQLTKQLVRKDRQVYKKREILNAIIASKLESVARAVSGASFNKTLDEKEPENYPVWGVNVIDNRTATEVLERHLEDELKRVMEEKGELNDRDLQKALRKAMIRAMGDKMMKSVKTPDLFLNMVKGAVMQFYMDYYKKHGRFPVIQSMNDAEEVLQEIEQRIEKELRSEPHYYLKGYVLGKLRRAKQGLK